MWESGGWKARNREDLPPAGLALKNPRLGRKKLGAQTFTDAFWKIRDPLACLRGFLSRKLNKAKTGT